MLDSNLANIMDLWGFQKGVLVFKDFSLGAAYKISAIDVACADDDTINSIKTNLRHFLNGLPQGLSLQFVQATVGGNDEIILAHTENKVVQSLAPLQKEILDERRKFLTHLDDTGSLPRRQLYVFVRKPFDVAPEKTSWSLFKKTVPQLREKHLEREVEKFERLLVDIHSLLAGLETTPERISETDVFEMIYAQWNPDRPADPLLMNPDDVRDRLCLTDAVVGIDNFSLGGIYHKVISLKMLPEQTFASMAQVLHLLPFESRLYFSIDVLDQQKETAALQMQRRMAFANSVGKKGVSDLDSQAKLADIEAILTEMIQGSERVFKAALQIVVRSKDLDELDTQVAEVLATIRELNGAEAMLETVASFEVFSQMALPHVRAKERQIKINTSSLADLVPVFGTWAGHKNPRVLLRSRDGALLPFDPLASDFSNNNMLLIGNSGSGKSYFANSLASQLMKESPKIFVVDIGGSYKRLCENLDGQVIEFGIRSNLSINCFDLTIQDRADPEKFDQKIKFLLGVVELMTKESGDLSLGKLEKAEIESAIRQTLNDEAPRLSNLKDRLLTHSENDIRRLGRILELWCGDSPFGKFVDRPTTIALEKDVVCFDMKGLDANPELQAVCLFIMMDVIWREVQKDRTRLKITIFDECWHLLNVNFLFLAQVFRTFRKYRGMAIALSQTIADFANSEAASAILPNTSIKWILKQRGADQEGLKQTLSLNEREMEQIASLESKKGHYSEAFLMAEGRRQIVRIETVPLEYWLFTTDPSDIAYLEQIKNTHPQKTGLELMREASQKYPRGVQGSGSAA